MNLLDLKKKATASSAAQAPAVQNKGSIDPYQNIKKNMQDFTPKGENNRLPQGRGIFVVNGVSRVCSTKQAMWFTKLNLHCLSVIDNPEDKLVAGKEYEHAIFDAGQYAYDWKEYNQILIAVIGLETFNANKMSDDGIKQNIEMLEDLLGINFGTVPYTNKMQDGVQIPAVMTNTIALDIEKTISKPTPKKNKDKSLVYAKDPNTGELKEVMTTFTNFTYRDAWNASLIQEAVEQGAIPLEIVHACYEGAENFNRALAADKAPADSQG